MAAIEQSTVSVFAELSTRSATVQIIRFEISGGHFQSSLESPDRYRLDLCLTPRPRDARAGFYKRWGPHRLEPIGDIFLVPPGHAIQTSSDRGWQSSVTCYLDCALIDRWLETNPEWNDRRLEACLDIGCAHIRALILRLAEEAHRPREGSDALAELAFGQLAIELGRYCMAIDDVPVTGGLSAWRLRVIDERLRDLKMSATLGELAALCNLSIRQLTRGFRTSRGVSIKEFIAQRRIEEGKRLLAGDEGVKAIAFAVGFASPSAFAFAFRAATGSTPLQFRQRFARATRVNA